jgi:hypothetical protein
VFLLNAAFAMKILNLISRVPLASFYHTIQKFKVFHIHQLFLIYHIRDDCLELPITLVFSIFFSIQVSITLSCALISHFNIAIKVP